MRISEIHALMWEEIRNQGPLVNPTTGLRSRHNRGVRHAWRLRKRQEAEARRRNSEVAPSEMDGVPRVGEFPPEWRPSDDVPGWETPSDWEHKEY